MKICNLKIDVWCEASVNFQHTSQTPSLPRSLPQDTSKVPATQNEDGHVHSAAPAAKTASHLLKTTQKYCACHTIRLSTRYETRLNVTKCHACHAKRSYATLETSKSDPFCRTYHRHGNTALTRTVADGCERLRTVADVNATSSEHTRNPQTPRVKREPLLRIREKHVWKHLKKRKPHVVSWLIMLITYKPIVFLFNRCFQPMGISTCAGNNLAKKLRRFSATQISVADGVRQAILWWHTMAAVGEGLVSRCSRSR